MSHIAKNLVNISKITKDNNVVVEFATEYCVIRDKITHTIY